MPFYGKIRQLKEIYKKKMCKTALLQAYIRKSANTIHHIMVLKEKNNMTLSNRFRKNIR